MKIKGKVLSGPNLEICIIPRGNEKEDIIFKCQAVLDMTDFERLCPEPRIPIMLHKGNRIQDIESPIYKAQIGEHNERRINFLIIKSLEATEDLEWDTVNLSDSSTWGNYHKELKDAN